MMTMDRPEERVMLTPAQVAKFLNLSERKIGDMLRSGELPGIKLGKEWRIDPDDLNKFITESKNK